jgi:hypothetical protein
MKKHGIILIRGKMSSDLYLNVGQWTTLRGSETPFLSWSFLKTLLIIDSHSSEKILICSVWIRWLSYNSIAVATSGSCYRNMIVPIQLIHLDERRICRKGVYR